MELSETLIEPIGISDIAEIKQVYRFGKIASDAEICREYALARFTNLKYYDDWAKTIESHSANGSRIAIKASVMGRVVGFAVAGPADTGNGYNQVAEVYPRLGEIHQIYVVAGFQRSGIGRRLYQKLLEELKACGYENVVINLLTGNTAAADFYRLFGAKKIIEIEEEKTNEIPGQRMVIQCDLMVHALTS
jgi:ribosomal protein S18 acetylase RimI-like enzyme